MFVIKPLLVLVVAVTVTGAVVGVMDADSHSLTTVLSHPLVWLNDAVSDRLPLIVTVRGLSVLPSLHW